MTSYFSNPRLDVLPYVPDSVRSLLDFGCAEGEFGARLKSQRRIYVAGIDHNLDVLSRAKCNLDRVYCVDLNSEFDLDDAITYDCLVFNDVLEHLIDPWAFLKRTRKYLSKDGWLLASIPNLQNHKILRKLLWNGDFRYAESGILDRTHLRFFTYKSAMELLQDSGFQIERMIPLGETRLPRYWRLLNLCSAGALHKTRYQQFLFLAKKIS